MPTATAHDPTPPTIEPPRKLPLLGIFIAWAGWGVWSAQQSILAAIVSGQDIPARTNPLSITIISASFWALITPVIMLITRRIRKDERTNTQQFALHTLSFVGVHLLDVTVYWLTSAWLMPVARPFVPTYFSLVTFNLLAYMVVAAIILALDGQYVLRARATRESQLETQLAMAQFHALRAQLHPHFLFNALNAVSSLIHSDPQRADRMLARVSELLRTAISTASQAEIPLADEIEFNCRYLEVERMRYGDRLDVRIDIANETRHALVPNMLLQPLVENAVRHGIAPHAGKGCVQITATRHGDELRVVVRDSGSGCDVARDEGDVGSGGVGVATTRARLRKLYANQQALRMLNIEGGFEVHVTLPFHVQKAAVA